jgi:hypothetical protein
MSALAASGAALAYPAHTPTHVALSPLALFLSARPCMVAMVELSSYRITHWPFRSSPAVWHQHVRLAFLRLLGTCRYRRRGSRMAALPKRLAGESARVERIF